MLGFGRLRCPSLYFCFAVGVFGCAADGAAPDGPEGGSLSLELTIADGIEIDRVSCRISGDDMDDMTGVINTSAPGATASVEVAGIPEGPNNLIEMEATSTDGETTCAGSANFDVTEGEVTQVFVMLRCKAPQRFGGVRVNGKFNLCAELTMVVASPMQTSVGNDIQLYTTAVDEEDDPISYLWSSLMGSIAEPTEQRTTYTCTEVGEDIITITASDDGAIFCMSDWTVPVTCVPGDGDPCEGVTCDDDGNECTRTDCNPASVQCETSNVNDGISCNGGEGRCSSGQCVDVDPCADVTCPDLGECRTSTCNSNTGTCEPSNVNDGTSCDSGDGTCMNGSCVDLNLCAGVTCPDLGECQSNVCNPSTGQCEASDVNNGTSCNAGGGMCIDGTCTNADLCMGVTCPSLGDCVDNVCNPNSGACESSTALDGTSCNGGAGVCMGGSCDLAATTVSIEFGGPPAVFIDQQFDYTIDLTNTGAEPASNVVVVVTLPGAGSLVSSDPAGATIAPDTLARASAAGLDPKLFLENND